MIAVLKEQEKLGFKSLIQMDSIIYFNLIT